ncbi:MarR family winged helix-turn-helix transcriptional regulator [Streptomyces fuscigenes]|uniref:MarR family winged helix-turn-helix transcriptional regulator n=1 Tax=Streptomyces fuscigenes TaxID=1528880 RepID=UPI001F19E424|nr:MarR family transcriptional regulator [Streptomyces fuscigenes]MCF3961940.1 MarR family transcriptional regulator [Streptomyces fuscigenes]
METTPGPPPSRAESITALQSVLSALAYSLTRTAVHARMVAAAGMPIDRAGLALLRVLAEEPEPLRVGELARRLDVRHPHVTRQVSQLAEQGLVERVESGDDRRVQLVAPTRRGLDTLARVVQTAEAKLTESLAGVDPERIMAAVDVLGRLDFTPGWGARGAGGSTGEGPPDEDAEDRARD